MTSIIQKMKASVAILSSALTILTVISFSLLVLQPASADVPAPDSGTNHAPGTCFYQGPDTDGSTKIATCKSLHLTTSQKDSEGKQVTYQDCYSVTATTSSESIVHVNCDGSAIGSTAQRCGDGNDGTVSCTTCPDGTSVPSTQVCGSIDPAATSGNCSNIAHCDLIQKYINPFVNFLAALAGVSVVISIIIGGIQYSSSAGDSQKVTAAKNRIRNAIIALVTFLFLYAMLNFLIPGGLV